MEFFFFNQQFITWDMIAVCGNYFVATVHWWADNMEMKMKKKKRKRKTKLQLIKLLHYCALLWELLLFFTVPISIEAVVLIRTTIAVCLMISFAIHIFEDMGTWLTIFGHWTISFLILHVIPYFLSVVFDSMDSIALGAPRDMKTTTKCWMSSLPTVLALWNTWVHVSIFDSSNKMFNVEKMINNVLCWRTTLGIPDVYPNYCHVWFGRHFDDIRFWGQHNIFEKMHFFEYTLNIVRWDDSLLDFVWKSNDFHIWFGPWETWTLDWVWIDIFDVLEVVLNYW